MSMPPLPSGLDRIVAIAQSVEPWYGGLRSPVSAPELPGGEANTVEQACLRELFQVWGLDESRFGGADWNPLGDFIHPGARVALKPNWVNHWNASGEGMECLITQTGVIEAVALYTAKAQPADIVVGDAPIQGCDFERLRAEQGVDAMIERLRADGVPIRLADFRRTVLMGTKVGAQRREDVRAADQFVEVDLAEESLLEPISADSERFRVAMYNPERMTRQHAPGRHRYLIARDILEADVVISLPKLKTHKKAGVTGALKNLVGINGNKEYLPHYRIGGEGRGGDSFAGGSTAKAAAERIHDWANRRAQPDSLQRFADRSGSILQRIDARLRGDDSYEGSWHGNDTVWRMCLDLQRALLYARTDGTFSEERQRRVIAITDAIIGGQGDGPLANRPIPSGFLTGGISMPAIEAVHCRLMGFDPDRIAIVREAFGRFRWPLCDSPMEHARLRSGSGETRFEDVGPHRGRTFEPATGWRGHCELAREAAAV